MLGNGRFCGPVTHLLSVPCVLIIVISHANAKKKTKTLKGLKFRTFNWSFSSDMTVKGLKEHAWSALAVLRLNVPLIWYRFRLWGDPFDTIVNTCFASSLPPCALFCPRFILTPSKSPWRHRKNTESSQFCIERPGKKCVDCNHYFGTDCNYLCGVNFWWCISAF